MDANNGGTLSKNSGGHTGELQQWFLPVYLTSVRPVEISHSFTTESLPLERMYLEFFEKKAEQTSPPSWAFSKVVTQRLETPSHNLMLPSLLQVT